MSRDIGSVGFKEMSRIDNEDDYVFIQDLWGAVLQMILTKPAGLHNNIANYYDTLIMIHLWRRN